MSGRPCRCIFPLQVLSECAGKSLKAKNDFIRWKALFPHYVLWGCGCGLRLRQKVRTIEGGATAIFGNFVGWQIEMLAVAGIWKMVPKIKTNCWKVKAKEQDSKAQSQKLNLCLSRGWISAWARFDYIWPRLPALTRVLRPKESQRTESQKQKSLFQFSKLKKNSSHTQVNH